MATVRDSKINITKLPFIVLTILGLAPKTSANKCGWCHTGCILILSVFAACYEYFRYAMGPGEFSLILTVHCISIITQQPLPAGGFFPMI